MSNKQSSVEYLIEHLLPKALTVEQYYHIEKAKAMHKEEMEHFFKSGMSLVEGRLWKPIDLFDEVYNKKFEGGNK